MQYSSRGINHLKETRDDDHNALELETFCDEKGCHDENKKE
jgi:hypothetical protein